MEKTLSIGRVKHIEVFPQHGGIAYAPDRFNLHLYFGSINDQMLRNVIPQIVIPSKSGVGSLARNTNLDFVNFDYSHHADQDELVFPVDLITYPTLGELYMQGAIDENQVVTIYNMVEKIAHHIIIEHGVYPFDLHAGNIMYDLETNQVVLFDLDRWFFIKRGDIDYCGRISQHISEKILDLINN